MKNQWKIQAATVDGDRITATIPSDACIYYIEMTGCADGVFYTTSTAGSSVANKPAQLVFAGRHIAHPGHRLATRFSIFFTHFQKDAVLFLSFSAKL